MRLKAGKRYERDVDMGHSNCCSARSVCDGYTAMNDPRGEFNLVNGRFERDIPMSDQVERLRQMVRDRLSGYHDPAICGELLGAADVIAGLVKALEEIEKGSSIPISTAKAALAAYRAKP